MELPSDEESSKIFKKEIIKQEDINLSIFPLNPKILQEHATITKILATIVLIGVFYLMYNIGTVFLNVKLSNLSTTKFLQFMNKNNILGVAVGLMIAGTARDFIKELTDELILPILQPIMPFIEFDYIVQIGPIKLKIGKILSNVIMFLINIYIIYVLVSAFSTELVLNRIEIEA
jgi:large-conductance mechanosensitive channel